MILINQFGDTIILADNKVKAVINWQGNFAKYGWFTTIRYAKKWVKEYRKVKLVWGEIK
jgi:hypothetical protein